MDSYTEQKNFENQVRKEANYTPIYNTNPPATSNIPEILGKYGFNTATKSLYQTPVPQTKSLSSSGGIKSYYDPTDYSARGVAVNAWGINKQGEIVKPDIGAEQQYYNELLKKSEKQEKLSNTARMGKSLVGIANAHQYYKDVKNTKQQYEAQKSIIDTNVMKTETAIQDSLTDNMASVDAMAAARNIDVSSGGIQGIKQQGGIEAGSDIRDMQEQANLNKIALDLDYAMRVNKAKQERTNSIVSGLIDVGTFAMGV